MFLFFLYIFNLFVSVSFPDLCELNEINNSNYKDKKIKKNIGIIFGGKSVEHEVSIITGLQAYENIDHSLYEPICIYIDKEGNWYHGSKLSNVKIYKNFQPKNAKQFYPDLNPRNKKNILNKLDAALLAMHGTDGEDGKIQSFLELANIPYTSSNVVGSATGMDKVVMKNIFAGLDLPVLPYFWFKKSTWETSSDSVITNILEKLDYPLFVKPANLGSSIGISLANNEKELRNAIDVAKEYDHRILVEQGLANAVEINCSAVISNNKILISELEEPVHWEKFLSFEDKYIRGNHKSKSGMANMARKIPADINESLKEKIHQYTRIIYQTMDCSGVVRIDYLLDEKKMDCYVNEINTIPGSFSFYLWEPAGMAFKKLLSILTEEAFVKHQVKKDQLVRYDSEILDKMSGPKGKR
ncbi:MAG: D-alanine--D-alanine ligase [Spirochaetes bacterium]|nr:D-alanine--D-alanine ligase [Spirochaetota bacterium]